MEKTNKKRSQKERNRDCSNNPYEFDQATPIQFKIGKPKTDKGYISDNPRQTFMWGREERGFREVERVV